MNVANDKKGRLSEVAWVFFRLGLSAFGGPAAHIAMMEKELVEEKRWMDRQHFLDLIGATNLIPGPNSTEMTMHCGHVRAGKAGLFVAGISFILPSAVITGILAWAYTEYGRLPSVLPFLSGIAPIVLALMSNAIWKLGKKALRNQWQYALGALVFLGAVFGMNEIHLIIGSGLFGLVFSIVQPSEGEFENNSHSLFLLGLITPERLTVYSVFWKFLKVGSILYGSGYILFAYLIPELVDSGHLSQRELMDAIAIGQLTPGPVLTTATFIGYQLTGPAGAMAATLGIFLPSFLFVLFLNPLIPKMRSSTRFSLLLDAVNVAALAVMAAVLFEMAAEVLENWKTSFIATVGLILTIALPRLSSLWLVGIGALLSFIIHAI